MSVLKEIIENNSTPKGKLFDYFIQALIVLSLISLSIETLPDLSSSTREFLYKFEVTCIIIFSIEYLLRVYVSDKPLNYIFSFYGVIDLIAIVPFFFPNPVDLRFLRIFRIFRIFRALKLIRYNKAISRFNIAIKLVKEELVLFLIVTVMLVFIVSFGIYYFENEAQPEAYKSVFHSMWWSIVTLTTVGYGDIYPITLGGKIFTFFVLIIGIGVVTIPAGLVATSLSKAREIQEKDIEP
jgi:voltage-gated potassium channel